MARFKTIDQTGKVVSISGELRVLAEKDGLRQKVELWLLNGEVNRNNWRYERIKEHRKLFADTPILVAYAKGEIGDGHNFEEVYNADGTITASFMSATAERIVGYFKNESDLRIEERDGKEWVVGTGYLWTWYAAELVAKLAQQGRGGMSVSIETLIDEMHYDGDTEVYTKYQILGTTILGDSVNPAVKNANIKVLSALGSEEVRKITLRVASEHTTAQENNPQKNLKGAKKSMKRNFSVEELRDKFPGYTVLAVDGNNVALLSDKGRMATYSFLDGENDTVVPERITGVAVNATFAFAENSAIEISAESLVAVWQAKLNAANAALAAATTDTAKLNEQVKTLQDAEKVRRKVAAKKAITDELAAFNSNRDEADKVSENECDKLLADAEAGKYSEMEENGEWCGDKCAANDVAAVCARKQMKIDKENAEKAQKTAKNTYIWETDSQTNGVVDGLTSMVNGLRKESK